MSDWTSGQIVAGYCVVAEDKASVQAIKIGKHPAVKGCTIKMSLTQLTQNGSCLKRIMCRQAPDAIGPELIQFQFETEAVALGVNMDTDELCWRDASDDPLQDLKELHPGISCAYGLNLAWSWEMKNHQGYFDAIQLEFIDRTLSDAVIFQFKVAASTIWLSRIEAMQSNTGCNY